MTEVMTHAYLLTTSAFRRCFSDSILGGKRLGRMPPIYLIRKALGWLPNKLRFLYLCEQALVSFADTLMKTIMARNNNYRNEKDEIISNFRMEVTKALLLIDDDGSETYGYTPIATADTSGITRSVINVTICLSHT